MSATGADSGRDRPDSGGPGPGRPARRGPSSSPRPPDVYWFDPTCDRSAGLGHAYTPVRQVRDMSADLEALPLFVAAPGDAVVVRQRPAPGFLRRLRAAGFDLPEFDEMGRRGAPPPGLLRRPLGRLRPWGWSPAAAAWAAPLLERLPASAGQRPDAVWNESVRTLYSKVWSVGFLGRLLPAALADHPEWAAGLCEAGDVGVVCETLDRVEAVARQIRGEGGGAEGTPCSRGRGVVVKAPFGASGQDQVRLRPPPAPLWSDGAQRRHVERLLREWGELVVEPYLEHLAELSLQLEIDAAGGARIVGISRPLTDGRGQYCGAVLQPQDASLGESVRELLWGAEGDMAGPVAGLEPGCLRPVAAALARHLGAEIAPTGYAGPAGVDMLVYSDDGRPRLKPVVEVNPRYTMGRVALALAEHVAPGSAAAGRVASATAVTGRTALWLALRASQIRAAGYESPLALARHLEERHPVRLTGAPASGSAPTRPQGLIEAGAVCTNDPAKARAVLGVLAVLDGDVPVGDPANALQRLLA